MSNSTLEAPAEAPSPAHLVTPASSPVGTTLVVPKVYNVSWIGIAGILAAFLVLAIVAVVCFWNKKRAFKQEFRTAQRELQQTATGRSTSKTRSKVDDVESARSSKRGQMTLADYEQALGSRTRKVELNVDSTTTNRVLEHQEIPTYTRDKHVVEGRKQKPVGELNWSYSFGENVEDEVFYKEGEEGSQMGVRYSSSDFDNLDIFSKVDLSPRGEDQDQGGRKKKKQRSESESASLLGSLIRSHTIAAASPLKAIQTSNKTGSWTLRTLSLPAQSQQKPRHENPPPRPEDGGLGLKEDAKLGLNVRVESLSKGIGFDVAPHLAAGDIVLADSPKHGYSPKFAYGNLSLAATQKPSRLSGQSGTTTAAAAAVLVHVPTYVPTFIVPPLPLPVNLDESEEKSLKELRKAMKQAETKWSIANYCPSAPPPPLPVPFQPTSPSPSLTPSPPTPPPSPPPPPIPEPRSPPSLLPPPSPPTPPPSPPPVPTRISRFAPPPPPSPPPPALPLPGSASRPKLAPLVLPGREAPPEPRPLRCTQPKMRPLHWDKLKPESRMVWDNISDSMELDEEMIENLFGVATRAGGSQAGGGRKSSFAPVAERIEILDPRKAHNIAIQLRARGLSKAEVCDALLEGDGLGQEILEILVKMAPTDEEATKFREFQGDPTLLGPADRFVGGVLQIPRAFERLQAMHYRASHGEELHHILETITTLEMACKELKGSRTFTKLLETVLKTGNRLNTGTFRGDAKAFKLDTLLKLADVKGVDGKTTLLHYVIQEIIKAEGARAARMAGFHDPSTPTSTRSSLCTTPSTTGSPSSPLPHFTPTMMESEFERCQQDTSNDFRRIGMDVVRGIPSELAHVRKAGALDFQALRLTVSKLQTGLQEMKATLEKLRGETEARSSTTYDLTDDVFRENMMLFVEDAESQVGAVQTDLDLVLASVKDISVYFYGEADTAKSTQPLKVFTVMREFLAMLEQACKDVVKANAASNPSTPPNSRPPSRPRSLVTSSK